MRIEFEESTVAISDDHASIVEGKKGTEGEESEVSQENATKKDKEDKGEGDDTNELELEKASRNETEAAITEDDKNSEKVQTVSFDHSCEDPTINQKVRSKSIFESTKQHGDSCNHDKSDGGDVTKKDKEDKGAGDETNELDLEKASGNETKAVQKCAHCSWEILSRVRYHCDICADYDECTDCHQNQNLVKHPHQLKPVATGRKELERSVYLHMNLLHHVAKCVSPNCTSSNYTKMKSLLKHPAGCKVKAMGGCDICRKIWVLLQIHARQCKQTVCPVPNCMAIREYLTVAESMASYG